MKRWLLLLLPILGLGFVGQIADFRRAAPHFPATTYDPGEYSNPAQVELGRVLFYDPILSRDSTVSCATCHSPYNGFAHTDHDLSHGIDGQIGHRNAPPLFNLAWQEDLMWDGAVHHIDLLPLAPISNPLEMDGDPLEILQKINRLNRYQSVIQKAWNTDSLSSQQFLKSLAAFQLSLVSATARYDSVRLGQTEFTPQEAQGYQIFRQHCNACHREPLFSSYEFRSNGLTVDTTLRDSGRIATTGQAGDRYLFKVPSLRNLAFTFPYMHDGRFRNLREVLQHYNQLNPDTHVSEELRSGISLSPNEMVDLRAFLLTLNDKTFVFDQKHQFPRDHFFPPPKITNQDI